jgi:O-antigen ligase
MSQKLARTIAAAVVSALLLVGGVATAVGAASQRAVTLRGWTDPAQSAPLPPHIPLAGVNVELTQYDAATLDRELNSIAAAGFVWVRQTFDWQNIEPTQGQFDFSKYDPIVAAVAAHPPLQIVAVLDNAPSWARRAEASDRLSAPPASMAAFSEYAAQIATRYGDRINYYQVWDEPNLNTQWGGLDPRPADYAAMLKAAYSAIHGHDASATVIAAALAPTVETGPRNISDVLYLKALYDLGAADSFDAAAGKPYGFESSPNDRTVREDVLNFSHIILLRDEMVRRGDGHKALWGSNFGWNHLPDGWMGTPSIWGQVDVATQRQYTRDAYQRAQREWPWMGGLILEHWQPKATADDPIQGFAVSKVAAEWFENGTFFAQPTLGPGFYAPTDPRFKFTGEWRFGPLGADVQYLQDSDAAFDGSDHQITFTFEGQSLALLLRRANYVAYVYARIDGKAVNSLPTSPTGDGYVLLKSPNQDSRTDLILLANNLGPGQHTADIRFYLGKDQWALAGIAIGSSANTRRFDLLIVAGAIAAIVGIAGLGLSLRRLPIRLSRENLAPFTAYIRRMADVIGGLVVSIVALMGMVLTWNNLLPQIVQRDTPTIILTILTAGLAFFSPVFIVTIIALIVLWFLIYNRPAVGLTLTLFWAPFFLLSIQLYERALPFVDVSLLLTASAMLVRGIVQWRGSQMRLAPVTWLRSWRAMDWSMLFFTVAATLTLLWAEQRAPALVEWRNRIIEPVIYYGLIRAARLSKEDLLRMVDVLLLAATVIIVLGLFGYFVNGAGVIVAEQGTRRLASIYGNYASPNNLALFVGRCIPFAFAMLLFAPGGLRKIIAGLITALMGVAVILTQSAGALFLGVPAALICVLWFWNKRYGMIAAGAGVVGFIALFPLSRFIPRLQGLLDLSRSSTFIRTQVWTSAINLIKERPLTGAGLDQFLYLYRSRYILPDAWREPDLSHPHNFLLDYWVSLGILGVVVLIALQVTFWRTAVKAARIWRSVDPMMAGLAVGAMGSMADFLAHGLVDNSYFLIDLAFVFCFTMALVNRLLEMAIADNPTS